MRVGVWNLECVAHKDRNPARLDFLRAREVDIWVLTEAHAEVNLSQSHPYAVHSAPRVRSRNGMHWVSIWSRFPIVAGIESGDVRTAIALLDTSQGQMLVYGTVWPWHSDKGEHPGDQTLANWARQAPVIAQQAAEWSQLKMEWPDAALCVAGDLNMTFGGPGSYASKAGRVEAEMAMRSHDLICTTAWSRLPEGVLDRGPIDHVLLPRPIADRTRIVEVWPGHPRKPDRLSDHSGLIVEIAQTV